MFTLFIFNRFSPERKLAYLKQKGIFVGTRIRGDKSITIYMLNDAFMEVTFNANNPDIPEHIQVFSSLKNLQQYLADDALLHSKDL